MTKEELAAELHNSEYGNEMTETQKKQAKEAGLVVVFGYSDDNVELRGAINEEVDAWDGTTMYFDENGLLQNDCSDENCPHFEALKRTAKTIRAISKKDNFGRFWAAVQHWPVHYERR